VVPLAECCERLIINKELGLRAHHLDRIVDLRGYLKAVAFLTKSRGVPASYWKPGNAESQRSGRGEDRLVAVLLFELECIGSKPNRIRRKVLENVHRYSPTSRPVPPVFDAFAG
jgi:hypothetical protein